MKTMLKNNIFILIISAMIINIFYIVFNETQNVEAGVIYEPGKSASTATWFYFSTNDSSKRAQFYRSKSGSVGEFNKYLKNKVPDAYQGDSRRMFKERYLNEYLWFTTNMPEVNATDVRISDMSYLFENRQSSVGLSGDYLVKQKDMTSGSLSAIPYRYNLKTGTINDAGKYMGYDSGHRQILSGHFYGKRFEWRYMGYDENGEPMHNPYFPDDYYNPRGKDDFTSHQNYWRAKDWYTSPWSRNLYQRVYGSSTKPKHATLDNMNKHFLAKYPLFLKTKTADKWVNIIVPMSDPNLSATIWTGVHNYDGHDYYVVFTTGGPPQPNLRLHYFGVFSDETEELSNYDPKDAIALRTRPVKGEDAKSTYTVKPTRELAQGEEVRIVTSYMNHKKKDESKDFVIKSTDGPNPNSFTVNLAVEHDNNIGKVSSVLSSEFVGMRTYTEKNKTVLNTNNQVWFNYPYKVGISNIPNRQNAKQKINLISYIPDEFYQNNKNTFTDDDSMDITLDVVGNNLKPEFVKFTDANGLETEEIAEGQTYKVLYKLVKTTKGNNKINASSAKLWVSLYDVPQKNNVSKTTTAIDNKVYDKNGKEKDEAILENAGDYTYHEAEITASSLKVCSYAVIQPSYYKDMVPNPNEVTEDDKTPEKCLENELNIIVSDVKASPNVIVLPSGHTTKVTSITTTATVTLDSAKVDKAQYPVLIYYTFDGKEIGKQNYYMKGSSKIDVSMTYNNIKVVKDEEHIVQVEANPKLVNGDPEKDKRLIREYSKSLDDVYADNVGWDILKVEAQTNVCPVNHQANEWTQAFNITETWWWWSPEGGGGSYTSRYTLGPYSFFERFSVSKLDMTVTETNKKYNLLNTAGELKAGQSFSLDIETYYRSNANIERSTTFVDNGGSYSNNMLVNYSYSGYYSGYSRTVSPNYRVAHNYSTDHTLYVETQINGQKYAIETVHQKTTGTKQDMKRTFTLPMNEGKDVIYVGENVKDGNYDITIKTSGFYGTTLKPSARNLCINQDFKIKVKGSTKDEIHSHVNNDFN